MLRMADHLGRLIARLCGSTYLGWSCPRERASTRFGWIWFFWAARAAGVRHGRSLPWYKTLHQDWENGRRYYAFHGHELDRVPHDPTARRSPSALERHLEKRFRVGIALVLGGGHRAGF